MLTHADDYRIMTDLEMGVAEDLSDLSWEEGASPREIRLMAHMRLLLSHIEGIKDGAVTVVEGLDEKRDPPHNDMTDMYDEGYAQCKKDASDAIRDALKRKDEK